MLFPSPFWKDPKPWHVSRGLCVPLWEVGRSSNWRVASRGSHLLTYQAPRSKPWVQPQWVEAERPPEWHGEIHNGFLPPIPPFYNTILKKLAFNKQNWKIIIDSWYPSCAIFLWVWFVQSQILHIVKDELPLENDPVLRCFFCNDGASILLLLIMADSDKSTVMSSRRLKHHQ